LTNRKPNAARHPDLRLVHRETIAREYLKGRYQHEIAAMLGISPATVKRDLVKIRRLWLESSLRDFDALKAEQLAKIDTVEAEAWMMWARSCERLVRTSEQQIEATRFPGCNVRTDSEQGTGDPRYLQLALQCVERRSKLLGLNAPEKIAHTNPSGTEQAIPRLIRDMSEEEREARIEELHRQSGMKLVPIDCD